MKPILQTFLSALAAENHVWFEVELFPFFPVPHQAAYKLGRIDLLSFKSLVDDHSLLIIHIGFISKGICLKLTFHKKNSLS